jgi:NADPH:quinone reductase-like Zn-dependent oxidoreductase
MRAIQIRDRFGLDNLAVTERPMPQPGPGQVLVRLTAATLNYRDLSDIVAKGGFEPVDSGPLSNAR